MLPRISSKALFPFHGNINLLSRHDPLFDEAVRNNRRQVAMEEVENAVVHSANAGTELVDTVAKIIGLRPAELVS